MDFSGKSILVQNLKTLLENAGLAAYFTREPGGTPAAERIRGLLLDPEIELDAWTEAYLYAAARADLTQREILPRLAGGECVICERYLDSSVAYQGYGRGLGLEAIRELNARAVGSAVPDRTFYLRLDAVERDRRARETGVPPDRIEQAGDEFMRRVEAGFEEIARREPDRVKVLDATRPPEELAGIVGGEILRGFPKAGAEVGCEGIQGESGSGDFRGDNRQR